MNGQISLLRDICRLYYLLKYHPLWLVCSQTSSTVLPPVVALDLWQVLAHFGKLWFVFRSSCWSLLSSCSVYRRANECESCINGLVHSIKQKLMGALTGHPPDNLSWVITAHHRLQISYLEFNCNDNLLRKGCIEVKGALPFFTHIYYDI